MLPPLLDELTDKLKRLPGFGSRSGRKLALDLLQLDEQEYGKIIESMNSARRNIGFCSQCGFFAQINSSSPSENLLCSICSDPKRNQHQICVVEKPTDVLNVEKSDSYRGVYHVLNRLISPLDNVFSEDTGIGDLIERLDNMYSEKSNNIHHVEIILFLKAGFSSEATIAYLRDVTATKHYTQKIVFTKLAQGLPLYYNPDTVDSATMSLALADRRML